jgi:hypothetical protein
MFRRVLILALLLLVGGCAGSGKLGQEVASEASVTYFYTLTGAPITSQLQQRLVRWILHSGGKYSPDPDQVEMMLEVVSEKINDRTISVNALGQPLLCEKTATLSYRIIPLSDPSASELLTARASLFYRRENVRETSLEYQNQRLQEKLLEDLSRYVSLQLTAWNQKHATDD